MFRLCQDGLFQKEQTPCICISLSMLVLDSRDQQGIVWLPQNLAVLAAYTILFTVIVVVKLGWSDTLS